MKKTKPDIITFKVDEALLDALKGVPNRSEFIRSAIMAALDGGCPLCKGTGVISANQKHHWQALLEDHSIEECGDCHEMHIICEREGRRKKNAISPGVSCRNMAKK